MPATTAASSASSAPALGRHARPGPRRLPAAAGLWLSSIKGRHVHATGPVHAWWRKCGSSQQAVGGCRAQGGLLQEHCYLVQELMAQDLSQALNDPVQARLLRWHAQ